MDEFHFRKKDLIILGVILLIAAASFIFYKTGHRGSGTAVSVSIDGQVNAVYELSQDVTVSLTGYTGGSLTMEIRGGQVSMTSSDCPDQICVKHRSISNTGESIICLPNRVVLEIIAGETADGSSSDDDLDFTVY